MGDYLALMMFPALLLALFLGFPVAFSMMGVALVFGLVVSVFALSKRENLDELNNSLLNISNIDNLK